MSPGTPVGPLLASVPVKLIKLLQTLGRRLLWGTKQCLAQMQNVERSHAHTLTYLYIYTHSPLLHTEMHTLPCNVLYLSQVHLIKNGKAGKTYTLRVVYASFVSVWEFMSLFTGLHNS